VFRNLYFRFFNNLIFFLDFNFRYFSENSWLGENVPGRAGGSGVERACLIALFLSLFEIMKLGKNSFFNLPKLWKYEKAEIQN